MGPDEHDPPESEKKPALHVVDSPPSSPPPESSAASPPQSLPHEIVEDFLSRRLTLEWLRAFVRKRVDGRRVDDMVQDILVEALQTKSVPRDSKALPSWLRTIGRRAVADDLTKRKRREAYEGVANDSESSAADTPDADAAEDDGSEPVYDPFETMDFGANGFLIRPWLERQVAGNARDKETFEILMERAESGNTYAHIAAERDMSLTALSARIFQFKKKYLPRYRRHRNRTLLLVLLGGAAAIVVAVALWWVFSAGEDMDRGEAAESGVHAAPSVPAPMRLRPMRRPLPGLEPGNVAHPPPEEGRGEQ